MVRFNFMTLFVATFVVSVSCAPIYPRAELAIRGNNQGGKAGGAGGDVEHTHHVSPGTQDYEELDPEPEVDSGEFER